MPKAASLLSEGEGEGEVVGDMQETAGSTTKKASKQQVV